MALRFALSLQVARHLSCCPATVRRRLLGELSSVLLFTLSRPEARAGPELGVLRLSSGFQVGYRLDRVRQQVELLSLSSPGRFDAPPAPA
jgi:hypothetical protein